MGKKCNVWLITAAGPVGGALPIDDVREMLENASFQSGTKVLRAEDETYPILDILVQIDLGNFDFFPGSPLSPEARRRIIPKRK